MILVTGFAPFLGQNINPSWEIAKALALDSSLNVEALELPVEFGRSFQILKKHIEGLNKFPDFILMLGQAQGRGQVCLERVALNWIETAYADEAGAVFKPSPILDEEQSAFIQRWNFDLKSLPAEIRISHSAGTYVCNELYFRTLAAFPRESSKIAFVHVPLIPQQVKGSEPSIELSKQIEIIRQLLGSFSTF